MKLRYAKAHSAITYLEYRDENKNVQIGRIN